MPVPVDVRRAAFRQLYTSAQAQGVTIQAALATAIAPSLAATLAGKQVIEAYASGTITKYALPPGLNGPQSADVAAMWSQIQDLYDLALTPVTNTPPGGGCTAETGSTPSATIYAWIMSQLEVVRSFSIDHSWPNIRI